MKQFLTLKKVGMGNMKVKAKKSLGQHFLRDEDVAFRIVDSMLQLTHKNILEVGPGMGVLSKYLLDNKEISGLKFVEIDDDSVSYLRKNYQIADEDIIPDDFLKMQLDDIFEDNFSVIGNFPYNISSQIFFKVLEHRNRVDCVVGMLQKEVAQRIAAAPGSKTYGILSVLLQAYYDVEYLFTVPPQVFDPPPKVDSAVISLTRNKTQELACDVKFFKQLVKSAFNQRRKTLRNSLSALVGKVPVMEKSIYSKRPEQLGVEEFVLITQELSV